MLSSQRDHGISGAMSRPGRICRRGLLSSRLFFLSTRQQRLLVPRSNISWLCCSCVAAITWACADLVLALYLRLHRDQEACGFCKCWVTTAEEDDCDRGTGKYRDVKDANVFEDTNRFVDSACIELSFAVSFTLSRTRDWSRAAAPSSRGNARCWNARTRRSIWRC